MQQFLDNINAYAVGSVCVFFICLFVRTITRKLGNGYGYNYQGRFTEPNLKDY